MSLNLRNVSVHQAVNVWTELFEGQTSGMPVYQNKMGDVNGPMFSFFTSIPPVIHLQTFPPLSQVGAAVYKGFIELGSDFSSCWYI